MEKGKDRQNHIQFKIFLKSKVILFHLFYFLFWFDLICISKQTIDIEIEWQQCKQQWNIISCQKQQYKQAINDHQNQVTLSRLTN